MSKRNEPIVFIVNSLSGGGAERVVAYDIREIRERGIDARLVTLKKETEGESFKNTVSDVLKKDRWQRIEFNSLFDFASWRKLISLLKEWRPQAVITHLWWANTIGRIAAWVSGVPKIIAFEQNVYDEVKSWKQFLVDRLLQYVSDKVVAVSGAVKKSLIRHGVKETKIKVIYNCINISDYECSEEIQQPLLLRDDRFWFVSIGSLTKQKNHTLLIEAFRALKDKASKDIGMVILGEGKMRGVLEEKIESLNLSNSVLLEGFVDNVLPYLCHGDSFVLSSNWEGLPVVILEAAAAGMPIISTRVDGVNEIIQQGKNGLLVERGNKNDLTEAMHEIVNKKEKQDKLAAGAKQHAEGFSVQKHVDKIFKVIE